MQAVPQERQRLLRVALVVDGSIRQERLLAHGAPLRVGPRESDDILLPKSDFPHSLTLLRWTGEHCALQVPRGARGSLQMDGGREWSLERFGGGEISLEWSARGRVQLGAAVLLFDFVERSSAATSPQLPDGIRSGVAQRIDWLFTAFVVFSFTLNFGFVAYLEQADWELPAVPHAVPERYARLIIEAPAPPSLPPEPDQVDVTSEPAPVPSDPSPRVTSHTDDRADGDALNDPSPTASTTDNQVRIFEEARRQAQALLVGAFGAPEGALRDVLKGGAHTGNAEDIFAQTEGTVVAERDPALLDTRPGSSSASRPPGKLGSISARPVGPLQEGEALQETAPKGVVRASRGEDVAGSGDFDVSLVTARMRSNLSVIQACYERRLRHDPALSGKVLVEFTIEPRGNLTGVKAVNNTTRDPALARCVTAAIGSMRFIPGPEGGSVTYAYPFVFEAQR